MALLAQAVMSLQAVKAVEIGRGVTAAESLGSAGPRRHRLQRRRRTARTRDSPASTTTPAASKAASPTAKTLSSAAISSRSRPCAGRSRRCRFDTRERRPKRPTSAAMSAWFPPLAWRPRRWSRSPWRGWRWRSSAATRSASCNRNYDGYLRADSPVLNQSIRIRRRRSIARDESRQEIAAS